MDRNESHLSVYNQKKSKQNNTKKRTPRNKEVSVTELPLYSKTEIKEIRLKLNMTQELFAKALGVSKKAVEAWENGRNQPNGGALRLMEIYSKKPSIMMELKIIRR